MTADAVALPAQNGTDEHSTPLPASSSLAQDTDLTTQQDDSHAPTHTAANAALAPSTTPVATDVAATKRIYLSLLPQEQIIDICLLFESHAPPDVRTAVWPKDLEAAVLELKEKAASKSSQSQEQSPLSQTWQPSSPSSDPVQADVPPMGSLRAGEGAGSKASESATAQASAPHSATPTPNVPSPAPAPPSHVDAGDSNVRNTPLATPSPQPPATPGFHAGPPGQPQPQQAMLHPAAPYPYAPYGYAVPPPQQGQPAYPHAPYYPPPHSYPSPYAYPHYPPPGYPTPPPPPPRQPHSPAPPHPHHPNAGAGPGPPSLFNSAPLIRPPVHGAASAPAPHPPQPPPPSGEDLPSYEEMLVEALVDAGDAEGVAPKDLFAWMAARYPLQTNFRPSASQALQKAFKRGRFEKLAGGKYRLNPSWEGGSTAKRTTRRPQTLAQTTYAMQHPSPPPPFTQTPLHHPSSQPTQGQPPMHYNGYQQPYPYPYGHYPGYPPPPPPPHQQQPPPQHPQHAQQPHPQHDHTIQPQQPPRPAAEENGAQTGQGPSARASKLPAEKGVSANDERDEGDALEAAQHILQAINFGNLGHGPGASGAGAGAGSGAGDGGSGRASGDDIHAVLDALANAAAAAESEEQQEMAATRSGLTEEERALVQAQLAQLAAQLQEIADGESEEGEGDMDEDEEVQGRGGSSAPDSRLEVAQAEVSGQQGSESEAVGAVPVPWPSVRYESGTPPTHGGRLPGPPSAVAASGLGPGKEVKEKEKEKTKEKSGEGDVQAWPVAAYSGSHLVLGGEGRSEDTPIAGREEGERDGTGVDSDSSDEDMEDVVVPVGMGGDGHGLRT